jgi:hypothetical protein
MEEGCRLDLSVSWYGPVMCFCGHSSEPYNSLNDRKFRD